MSSSSLHSDQTLPDEPTQTRVLGLFTREGVSIGLVCLVGFGLVFFRWFLHQGQICEEGPPDQLFRNPQTDQFRAFLSRMN